MNDDIYLMQRLRDMFPNKRLETLTEALTRARSNVYNSADDQITVAIDYLINYEEDEMTVDDFDVEGAVGYMNTVTGSYDMNYLLEVYPDCCPSYLRDLCAEKGGTFLLEDYVDHLSNGEYPKRDIDPLDTLEQLKEMLPNADPSYLEQQARSLAFEPVNKLKEFIEHAIEKADYPTMQDYLKNKKEKIELDQYKDAFNAEEFIKKIPNPMEYFSKRPNPLSSETNKDEESLTADRNYALKFLVNHYRCHRIKDINKIFESNGYDLVHTTNRLDRLPKAFKQERKIGESGDCKNVALLQEIAFLTHKRKIKDFLKWKDENYRKAKEDAIANGLLQTCLCCFDDGLIPEECYFCKKGCLFCKDCVKFGAEQVIGEGNLKFPCLAACDSEFSIPTLQMVLDLVVFSRLAQRMQMEEVKQAKIENIETCPFCDYSTIPAPGDKIFKCLNVECMKESCRECGHMAHIPLRCNEIEYDEDVKMRTYIENKMTEALLRKCWKCNKVFIKESGCNKMTCQCGATMCYVCGQAVKDYHHFGTGRSCPLYTENLNRFHYNAVVQGAARAKQDLGLNANPNKLKFDPTRGIDRFM